MVLLPLPILVAGVGVGTGGSSGSGGSGLNGHVICKRQSPHLELCGLTAHLGLATTTTQTTVAPALRIQCAACR